MPGFGLTDPVGIASNATTDRPNNLFRIHSIQRALSLRHLLPTRDRFLGGLRYLRRHVSLDVTELLRFEAVFLQVLLIEAHGIALAPRLKQLGRKCLAGLALVVGGVAAHPERFRNQQRGPITGTTPLGGDPCDS